MSTLLHRVGGSAARHPWRVISAWLVTLAAATALANAFGGVLTDDLTIPHSSSQRANDLLAERFPTMSGTNARVVAHADSGSLAEPELAATANRLRRLPDVSVVSAPILSRDSRTALLTVQYGVPITELEREQAQGELDRATAPLAAAGMQVEYGGELPESMVEPDGRAEVVGILAALVILLLAFGSIVAAGLPLAVAMLGLGVGTAGISLLAAVTEVSPVTTTLATMVGLGVGIDYALFIVTRHRDGLAAGLSVEAAAAQANATAGHSVVVAGGTVLLALMGLQFAGIPNFAMMGYGTGVAVLATMLAAVTLLPALLGLLGLRVYSRRARRAGRLEAAASHSPAAAGLAQLVGNRPLPWLVGALSLIAVLAGPALGMRIGQSDAGIEPTTTTTRQAYDLVAEGFGPGANGPLVVAADLQKIPVAALPALRQTLAARSGVADVTEPVVSADGTAAVLTVTPTTGPQDDRTTDLVRALREDVLPAGADLTGFTAAMIDVSQVLSEHLWLVILLVIAASMVLLLMAFRSLLVPLKAAAVNLLSVGAAFGAITVAFQTKAGADLLGLPAQAPVPAYVPVLMFAVLFGLSMDYEVFLLSRVREEYLRSGDPRKSVTAGLAGTARVITSAALIMVAVFLGFAFDPSVVVKMVGLGMAVAIAVDATIIRLILVPATMTLLGKGNWYLPRWLDRLLPETALREPSVPADSPTPQRIGTDLVEHLVIPSDFEGASPASPRSLQR